MNRTRLVNFPKSGRSSAIYLLQLFRLTWLFDPAIFAVHKVLVFPDEPEGNLGNINRDNRPDPAESKTESGSQKSCDKPNTTGGDLDKPWQTLVSYVDELTVGGRRNSKGQFVDGMGSFIGFGKKKKPREAPDCFPSNVYEK